MQEAILNVMVKAGCCREDNPDCSIRSCAMCVGAVACSQTLVRCNPHTDLYEGGYKQIQQLHVSLLKCVGKVMIRILQERRQHFAEDELRVPESRCGVHKGWSCSDNTV
jgi:hypothetical protein